MRGKLRFRKSKSNLGDGHDSMELSKLKLARPFRTKCPALPPELPMETSFTKTCEILILQDEQSLNAVISATSADNPAFALIAMRKYSQGYGYSIDLTLFQLMWILRSRLSRSSIPKSPNFASDAFSLLKLDKISAWGPTTIGVEEDLSDPCVLTSLPLRLTVYNYMGTPKILDSCPPTCAVYYLEGTCSAQSTGARDYRSHVSISNPGAQFSSYLLQYPEVPIELDPIWANISFGFPYSSLETELPKIRDKSLLGVIHVTLTGIFCRDSVYFNP